MSQDVMDAVSKFISSEDNKSFLNKVEASNVSTEVGNKVYKAAEKAAAYAVKHEQDVAEAVEKAVHRAYKAQLVEGLAKKGHFLSSLNNFGNKVVSSFTTTFNIGEVSEKPNVVSRGASRVVNFFSNRVNNNPRLFAGAAIVGTVALGTKYIRSRAEKRTEQEAQEVALQAQAAASQQPRPQQTWKDTVTAADMAAMQARMEADGKATPAFAAAAEASKGQQPIAAGV